ncbi:NADH-plastoquinone oxidoreductase subunit 3 [Canna indica]|uniref:NADH-ubiquinone oxidoreductase chain 3 n=1 Tax=Canna indica TaxID=4628 RepID=A0AAQ3K394_9LILI|nr:NADH-plastoquinone oxidoreductase subunit 3 [Canna indica]
MSLGCHSLVASRSPFAISGVLAPVSEGPEKLSSYESGIEPMGDAWLQFRIRYYMFALVFVVFDVETVFLYPWAMSFDVLGVSLQTRVLVHLDASMMNRSKL